MQRQADVRLIHDRSNDSEVTVAWKLCDNGFPVDEGVARYLLGAGRIDWRGHTPPAEDEGLLRAMIEERIRATVSESAPAETG